MTSTHKLWFVRGVSHGAPVVVSYALSLKFLRTMGVDEDREETLARAAATEKLRLVYPNVTDIVVQGPIGWGPSCLQWILLPGPDVSPCEEKGEKR